ncbi:MAG: ATP-binding cassette domain-containing protein, partial [Acidimicrobiia bacterium]|nr:ATP-binding cassette domain-containing protein [Acidimicrobiia bacterium]
MSETLAVDLRDVSVLRDGVSLLADITWRVARGERWVLFGPNGSGKTTLMEVVSTYLGPSRGSARILGWARGKGADVR